MEYRFHSVTHWIACNGDFYSSREVFEIFNLCYYVNNMINLSVIKTGQPRFDIHHSATYCNQLDENPEEFFFAFDVPELHLPSRISKRRKA